uniref:Small ribosomal subunit biogenesis GTPase RsgA n=1 Tax=Mesoaciditoga lauensis TaxID=1495039 RepID=A0A7V3RE93_9BACT
MRATQEKNTLKKGTIVSFNSNLVTVEDYESGEEILCTLRGRFKLTNTKPMVGDRVEYTVDRDRGRVESILPRINVIDKPKISNVDQAVVVVTLSSPDLPYATIDRIILNASRSTIALVLILNKIDLTDPKKINEFKQIYRIYDPILSCVFTGEGIDELKFRLKDHISIFTGPSGVGKSSLLNSILNLKLKTGCVSQSTNFGKHTTSSATLIRIEKGGFVVDTPGFTTIELSNIKPLDVQNFFPEIKSAAYGCAFDDCAHENEPGCNVKALVEKGEIPLSRYENYLKILKEVKDQKIRGDNFEKKY